MAPGKAQTSLNAWLAALAAVCVAMAPFGVSSAEGESPWPIYQSALKGAKYVDLTHTITPNMPVWAGFAKSTIAPAKAGSDTEGYAKMGEPYTYEKHGFEATEYALKTDQLGTQLDPPAHWAPEYPAIDELPATYAIRPLVVISIVDQVKADPNYALTVADIEAWEKKHGRIPEGSIVFVRSDWSKAWPDPKLATLKEFPGVGLDALKFLHEQRKILFHGHEPLNTDSTPNLEGEHWLMHHGYAQAEGVANLDKVPETGALLIIGYAKFGGGLGGYATSPSVRPIGRTARGSDLRTRLCRSRTSPCTTTPRPACACASCVGMIGGANSNAGLDRCPSRCGPGHRKTRARPHAIHHPLEVAPDSFPVRGNAMKLVFAVVASLAIGGCAVLAGAGLGGAGGFLVAGPPGAVVGAGAGAVGGAVGSSMRR